MAVYKGIMSLRLERSIFCPEQGALRRVTSMTNTCTVVWHRLGCGTIGSASEINGGNSTMRFGSHVL